MPRVSNCGRQGKTLFHIASAILDGIDDSHGIRDHVMRKMPNACITSQRINQLLTAYFDVIGEKEVLGETGASYTIKRWEIRREP